MKSIKYQIAMNVNVGTAEQPDITQTLLPKEIQCDENVFDSNYAIALAEAYNGEITVEDLGADPELEPENSVWDELAAAYTEGVNSAYDQ